MPDCDFPLLPLEVLYAECDIISLHMPLTAETTGMINDASISNMKRVNEGVRPLNIVNGL